MGHIQYEEDGQRYDTTRRFGPVKIDPEIAPYERSFKQESFRVKIIVENLQIEMTLTPQDDGLLLSTRDNLELRTNITGTN